MASLDLTSGNGLNAGIVASGLLALPLLAIIIAQVIQNYAQVDGASALVVITTLTGVYAFAANFVAEAKLKQGSAPYAGGALALASLLSVGVGLISLWAFLPPSTFAQSIKQMFYRTSDRAGAIASAT